MESLPSVAESLRDVSKEAVAKETHSDLSLVGLAGGVKRGSEVNSSDRNTAPGGSVSRENVAAAGILQGFEIVDDSKFTAPSAGSVVLNELAEKYGVKVVYEKGQYEIREKTGKEKHIASLDTFDASNLGRVEKILTAELDLRQRDVESRFGVRFSSDNELAINSYDQGKPPVKARRPKLDELPGVEAALSKSQPSQRLLDGRGIKFYFLTEKTGEGIAFHGDSVQGEKAVFLNPDASSRIKTEVDALSAIRKGSPDQRRDTLESILVHELAHNAQKNLGLFDDKGKAKELASQLGWVQSESSDSQYFLKGKDGSLYSRTTENVWLKVAPDGKEISTATISNREMRELAIVRPGTEYFKNPIEMHADALQLYRLGSGYRTGLLLDSPQLYRVAQATDQLEIDRRFGSGRIRLPDSSVVASTPESATKVANWRLSAERSLVKQLPVDNPGGYLESPAGGARTS